MKNQKVEGLFSVYCLALFRACLGFGIAGIKVGGAYLLAR
jgi:hypothetical protein